MSPHPACRRHVLPTSPFRNQPAPVFPVFAVNDRVTHERHGLGRVIRIAGDRMDVKFGDQVVNMPVRNSKVELL